ncbi:hypothetical protein V6615_09580 [Oscillospiraceae bacterium PP1C4]
MIVNLINQQDVPMGFGMALAQNLDAMNRFSALSPEQQKQVISHTHQVGSKQEMQQYVQQLADQTIRFS